MRTGTSRACVGGLALMATMALAARPHAARTQTSTEAAVKAQARLLELDANHDGVLSGAEVDACRCRPYDTDGDGRITKAEFHAGFMLAAFAAQQPLPATAVAPPPPPPPTAVLAPYAVAPLAVGDRVDLQIGDIWFPGVIYAAQGGQYSVNRDNYGRTRFTPGEVRRELRPEAQRPRPGPAGVGQFLNGERVEVTTAGGSYRGNIGVHEFGTDVYQVDRYNDDGVAAQGGPVGSAQLRHLDRVPAAAGLVETPPPNLMVGTYLCTATSNSITTTIGRLLILGPATYTGITMDGSGPQRRYLYDPATGRIEWVGGLASPQVIMAGTDYRIINKVHAEITLYYRVVANGFALAMTCARDGA